MTTKTWQVGSYGDDWVVIVHAETRGRARAMGATVGPDWFTDMRAIRLPTLDGKLITVTSLIEAGFQEKYEGWPIDVEGYVFVCWCEICKDSLALAREKKNANA